MLWLPTSLPEYALSAIYKVVAINVSAFSTQCCQVCQSVSILYTQVPLPASPLGIQLVIYNAYSNSANHVLATLPLNSGGGTHLRLGGGAGVASQYGHEVRRFLHYVTPSTEKRSRGTLGYV